MEKEKLLVVLFGNGEKNFVSEDRGRAKKVAQLDDNNNIIAIFDSVSEASRKTGASRKGISAVSLGK